MDKAKNIYFLLIKKTKKKKRDGSRQKVAQGRASSSSLNLVTQKFACT